MAFTQADLDAVNLTIANFGATGVLSVSFSGPPARTVSYRTLDEIIRVKQLIESELAKASGKSRVRHVASASFLAKWGRS